MSDAVDLTAVDRTMARETGGPAFPNNVGVPGQRTVGMWLRDYFAAHAPQPSIENLLEAQPDRATALREAAQWAYAYADAMLEARK